MKVEKEAVTSLVAEIGIGCNLACRGCQGNGRRLKHNLVKVANVMSTADIEIINATFPNLEVFRWGGIWSEPTMAGFALASINQYIQRVTKWQLTTITNGIAMLKRDLNEYIWSVLGYSELDSRQQLFVSIDQYHRESFLRNGGKPEEYQEIINKVNMLSNMARNGSLFVNTVVNHEGEVANAIRYLREQLGLLATVPVGVLTLSVYARIQEVLLENGAIDLRGSNGLPDHEDPVYFIRREKNGLTFYPTIADLGYRRNGEILD